MTYEVRLDVYEGPFELLLTLISERRVDVCDVPIAVLTEEYLARISEMADLDLEVTTEFLVVAATLLQLKARALLPKQSSEQEFEDDLERDVLIARLLEVRTFRAAGELLAEQLLDGDKLFPGSPPRDDPALAVLPTLAGIDARELPRVLVELVADRVRPVDTATLLSDEITAEDAAAVVDFALETGPSTFEDIVRGRTIPWAIAIFLVLLEMSMRGEVDLGQAQRLGDIQVRPLRQRMWREGRTDVDPDQAEDGTP